MNAAAYVRTARPNCEEQEAQTSRLIGYAKAHGLSLLSIQCDTCSGVTLQRPGLERLIRAAKKHEIKAVLVCKLDRLARDPMVLQQICDLLSREGVTLISSQEDASLLPVLRQFHQLAIRTSQSVSD